MEQVCCASALSTRPSTSEALDEVCQSIRTTLGEGAIDLALVFASAHHYSALDELPAMIRERLDPAHLIGCTGEGIVGRSQEVEEEPALSVWVARLPSVTIHPFHVTFDRRNDEVALHGWPEPVNTAGQVPVVLLFPEPFSSDPMLLIEQFQTHYPEARVIGGVASGGMRPGRNRLFLDGESHEEGAVGMLLWSPSEIQTLVSQGCRPIGRHMVVTKGSENVIHELGGQPAFAQFQQVYESLDEPDQQLARRALHIGLVIDEHRPAFERGDFLVRNILGVDPNSGSIAIADHVRVGQTVQFHVRDAETASEDLKMLLESRKGGNGNGVAGVLIFSCNGRGTRMFDDPNHDADAIQESLGDVPLAGFFAQGEIGPVGNRNFLHGFTASLALFGDASAQIDDEPAAVEDQPAAVDDEPAAPEAPTA